MREINPLASKLLGPGGPLALAHPSFETRVEQLQMASAVLDVIEAGGTLLAEAGTGVGKSLAYLVPFCLWAVEHERRVVISTQTKALQHQLLDKDIPLVAKALGIEPKVVLCLGSGNYLCWLRLDRAMEDQMELFPSERGQRMQQLLHWAEGTTTGLRHDLPFPMQPDAWNEICRESDLCMGPRCQRFGECFYYRAKSKERKAHVLLVNHHLYFSNEAIGRKALAEFHAVVFDEAHHLDEVATQHLGINLTNAQMLHVFTSVFNPGTSRGALTRMGFNPVELGRARQHTAVGLLETERFFKEVAVKTGESLVLRIREPGWIQTDLCDTFAEMGAFLRGLLPQVASEEDEVELTGLATRAEGTGKALKTFLAQEDREAVHWVERHPGRRRLKATVHVTPVDVSDALRRCLFQSVSPLVLTSATLSDGRRFDFLRQRLGIDRAEEILLGSPFNYQENVLLFASAGLPDPKEFSFEIPARMLDLIERLIRASGGGAFVLFTSYRAMRRAHQILSERLSDEFQVFLQGERSTHRILEEFRSSDSSVLFATSSFWQGVDVPGQALRCVILIKLPFAVPDDPVTEARMERLVALGKDPFWDYQLPQAVIRFRQGFGRLIRRDTDRGVVAVLDPRILTRRYGRLFLRGIPTCQATSQVEDVEEFFGVQG